jgi:hypothetical protein
MRLALFDDVMEALNGRPQDYHSAALLSWAALQSPLLDLLNVRYIVVPLVDANGNAPPDAALAGFSEVWSDDQVRILENQDVLPRAWLVTDIRQAPIETVLPQLADGSIDTRQTALIQDQVPAGIAPGGTPAGAVTAIERTRPEQLRVSTSTGGPALLVFSEIAYPAWRVTIDGESADLIAVNHGFTGVFVPPGEHTIELVYTGRTEKIGLGISGIAIFALAGYGAWFCMRRRMQRE